MSAEKETPWICIARTGTFEDSQGRPHTFTEADLERISKGYDPARSEAPLVFGHPKDDAPAHGWVAALKREGGRLFAQFAHVPEKVRDLVQGRRYRYVSMSLSPDKTRLLHVGLLGAAAPAIDGLGPAAFEAAAVTINFSAQENDNVDIQALQQQIGALHEQIKLLRADNDKLRADFAASDKLRTEAEQGRKDAEEKNAKAAADFAAFKGQIAADTRKARVDALINSGKLEPSKKDETLSFAAALAQVQQPVNFAAPDGKTEQISAEERYFRELEGRSPDPRFANFTAPAPAHAAQAAPEAIPADITNKL